PAARRCLLSVLRSRPRRRCRLLLAHLALSARLSARTGRRPRPPLGRALRRPTAPLDRRPVVRLGGAGSGGTSMEFRWLTTDEQRTRAVESSTLSDVLALAQQLQAEGEGSVGEEQVLEMGRELGVQPQYIREALRLRRRAEEPARSLADEAN